jgi:flagellar hook protein FlgE
MDVIADNIANTNTTGFKSSKMAFIDSFQQVLRRPTASQPVGIQIGLGNQISVVNQNFNQGAFQRTGVTTDIALSGDGFMIINSAAAGAGTNYFSRDGAFTIDKNGWLINSLGYRIRGPSATWNDATTPPTMTAQATDPGTAAPAAVGDLRIPPSFIFGAVTETTVNYSVDTSGKVTLYAGSGTAYVSGYITIAKFSNPQGLNKEGNNLFTFNEAAGSLTGGTSFNPLTDVRKAGTNGTATTQSGALELSNVDLADSFTDMIITQRGFDANGKVITTVDEMLQVLNSLKR